MSSYGIVLHNNARLHTAAATKSLLQRFRCKVFDHPPYRTNLAPRMERCPGGKNFGTENELETSVGNWLKAQTGGFYDAGIEKLVPRYEKCLRRSGDYVEKCRKYLIFTEVLTTRPIRP